MNYVDQEIALDTETEFGADVPLSISAGLLRRLEETARPCVRMAIRRRQRVRVEALLRLGWNVPRTSGTLGFSERNGQSILHVKAPTLGEAVPEVFDQQKLWPGMASAEDTAIQLIGRVGHIIRSHETASDKYDQPLLLKRLTHWPGLFKRQVKELRLPAFFMGTDVPVTLNIEVVENAKLLSAQTPAPRQIRIIG